MGSFSNILLTVDKKCGDNLLNPSDEDIIAGVGVHQFNVFCEHGFIYRHKDYDQSCLDADGKIKKSVILKELRKELSEILSDVEEKGGDRYFTISEIKDGCVEEDVINHILNKHGEKSYLEVIESIDFNETLTHGQYIDNAFSNNAEISLFVSNDENPVITACKKLVPIYGEERIGDMLREACDEWQKIVPKL